MKNYNTLNRALIKKIELLPNVFEFKTEKYGIHEYAAIYGIEKIVRRCKATQLLKSQPNFYLERQHKRLVQYAANGEIEKFNYLSEIILRKSNSYRVLCLNRTLPHWWEDVRELRRVWTKLKGISSSLSSDLKFKRVWIDKKEGDFARPLGVPTPAWRCYAFGWMNHIETFMKAAGYLAPWQHGGRSGVGVLSCYRQLIPKLKESNTIFEFDIKGFFDNISHEKIIEEFKNRMGPKTAAWVENILKATPYKYVMPSEQEDQAYQKYLADSRPTSKGDDIFAREWKVVETHGPVSLTDAYISNLRGIPEGLTLEDPFVQENLDWYERKYMIDMGHKHNIQQRVQPDGSIMHIPLSGNALDMIGYFEDLRKFGQVIEQRIRAPVVPLEREHARDKWKNLGIPGKGVPQGLNTSPFISTFLTDIYLKRLGTDLGALIMYMDDGILFAKSKAQMGQYIRSLKGLLKKLDLELAEEKCQYVKEDGVWKNSLRFLGLRYLPESDTIMSDTRSGTKVLFPANNDWENVKEMARVNNMSISNVREKFDELINTRAYEAGLKYGFLGCLIAGSQYKEGKSLEERREDIERGQGRSWARILKAKKGFIWKTQDLYNHVEYIKADEISLTNYSSVATHRFLDFLSKGRKLFIHKRGFRSRKQRV